MFQREILEKLNYNDLRRFVFKPIVNNGSRRKLETRSFTQCPDYSKRLSQIFTPPASGRLYVLQYISKAQRFVQQII